MPTAKPRYDSGGDWKLRQFDRDEWVALEKRIQKKLRPFYPDKNAKKVPKFGHPADGWANYLLSEAWGAVSMMLWLRRRLTNEELRAERKDLLSKLNKADECLSKLSHDLDIMLGADADVLGCRDKLRKLIQRVEATEATIARLSMAKKPRDAEHEAAVEMAIHVLRVLKDHDLSTAATADADLGYFSDAVQILKIIGDEFGLVLAETTWRDTILKAKQATPELQ